MTAWRRLLRWLGLGPKRRPFRREDYAPFGAPLDMDPLITMLDPDMSQFSTMLMALSGPRRVKDARLWDDWLWQEWSDDAEAALRHYGGRELPQDYFVEAQPSKVEWLEDEMFPRTFQVKDTNHPYFRKGDIAIIQGNVD